MPFFQPNVVLERAAGTDAVLVFQPRIQGGYSLGDSKRQAQRWVMEPPYICVLSCCWSLKGEHMYMSVSGRRGPTSASVSYCFCLLHLPFTIQTFVFPPDINSFFMNSIYVLYSDLFLSVFVFVHIYQNSSSSRWASVIKTSPFSHIPNRWHRYDIITTCQTLSDAEGHFTLDEFSILIATDQHSSHSLMQLFAITDTT